MTVAKRVYCDHLHVLHGIFYNMRTIGILTPATLIALIGCAPIVAHDEGVPQFAESSGGTTSVSEAIASSQMGETGNGGVSNLSGRTTGGTSGSMTVVVGAAGYGNVDGTSVAGGTGIVGAVACVVRVSGTTGNDSNLGDSWPSAVASVQVGLDLAEARMSAGGFGSCDVWVAAGLYHPSANNNSASITLHSNVGLYGGFAGQETDRSQRNWATHPAVLSGDLAGDDIAENLTANRSDNSTTILTGIDGSTLDGFTITGGAQAVAGSTGTLQVRNCHIMGNSSVGISNPRGGSLTVDSCVFDSNGGEAITASTSSITNVSGSSFVNNSTCISSGGTNLIVANSTFSKNSGTAIEKVFGSITVTQCQFVDNQSGSAISASDFSSGTVTNSVFRGNSGTLGGAIAISLGSFKIANSLFWGNSASQSGGALYVATGPAFFAVSNSTFNSNSAPLGNVASSAGSDGTTYTSFKNSILWGNNGTTAVSGVTKYGFSIVEGGTATGTIDADPLFADSIAGDLHLLSGSPAINAGDIALVSSSAQTVDLDGNPRVVGNVDIGAYEY